MFSFKANEPTEQTKVKVVSGQTQKTVKTPTLMSNPNPLKDESETISVKENISPKKLGNFFIKLRDTYPIRYNANNRKKQILNYPAFIEKHIVKNVTTYFVIVGPFSSKEEAQDYLKLVQGSQFPFKGKIFTKDVNKSPTNSIN